MLKHIIVSITVMTASFAYAIYDKTEVKLQGDTLYYTGGLETDAIAKVKKLYKQAKPKPTVLEIDSPGGVTEYGMDLGAFVADNDLSVRVVGMCFSSCANFVFPVGKTVYIGKDAFVGWHGDGTSSTIYEELKYGITLEQSLRQALLESYKQYGQKYTEKTLQRDIKNNLQFAEQQNAKEDAFYQKYNVNPLLARYPHLTQAGRQDLENSPANSAGWTYTPEILKKLGINVVLIHGTWGFNPENYDKQKPDFMGGTLHLIRKVTP